MPTIPDSHAVTFRAEHAVTWGLVSATGGYGHTQGAFGPGELGHLGLSPTRRQAYLHPRSVSAHPMTKEQLMNAHDLQATARALVAPGKGILAADESSRTIEKRLSSIKVDSTEENRRAWRELLFTTAGAGDFISGVILFDETTRQVAGDGRPFSEVLEAQGIIPGIKVDKGTAALAGAPGEKITEGLDGLRGRLAEYRDLGAKFTKWRAVITIGEQLPTRTCLLANAEALALFAALREHHVRFEGMLLKPNMVLSGDSCPVQATPQQVAEATVACLRNSVPAAVPGIVFLSGGQSDTVATVHLNAMNRLGPQPWQLSFSYGRALQAPALQAWKGEASNVPAGQAAFHHRAKLNGAARSGSYSEEMEKVTT